jgi:hypothetical protein
MGLKSFGVSASGDLGSKESSASLTSWKFLMSNLQKASKAAMRSGRIVS